MLAASTMVLLTRHVRSQDRHTVERIFVMQCISAWLVGQFGKAMASQAAAIAPRDAYGSSECA